MSASFWKNIRSDFPITKRCTYLDHASGGPLPRPVFKAVQKHYQEHLLKADFAWNHWIEQREEVRRKVACFINADPSEITFTQSTSQGVNWIAELLAAEGSILINTSEFPSSTLPWIWRKAKIIWQEPEDSKISLVKLKALLSPKVKTIVTSFVQYATGFRQDLPALGNLKGNRYLVVNATQGFGAFPIDVQKSKIDFLCTNSYKWLMAGYGGGVLYIRKKWLSKFKPSSIGWRSMTEPEQMNNQRIALRQDAGRYEWGCPSFPTMFAVGASIDYMSKIGIEKIAKRILELTDYLVEGLEKKGAEVISPREGNFRSGIVVFKAKKPQELCSSLLRRGIYVSPRGVGIRVAPHFYNTFEEIDKFLKILGSHSRML